VIPAALLVIALAAAPVEPLADGDPIELAARLARNPKADALVLSAHVCRHEAARKEAAAALAEERALALASGVVNAPESYFAARRERFNARQADTYRARIRATGHAATPCTDDVIRAIVNCANGDEDPEVCKDPRAAAFLIRFEQLAEPECWECGL
jgi:hypothetical protein